MIITENLTKIYSTDGGVKVKALDGISLEIKDGEFISIVGASGSGKTTLMNIIGCLDIPTEGKYTLDGSDISLLGSGELSRIRSRKISFVFQGFNLIPSLTAAENVELPLIYRKTEPSVRKRTVAEALEAVGLAKRANHLPSELSGGQQQRVAIGRALATEPKLILADEPTGNLDSKNSQEVIKILWEISKEYGRTVLLITHNHDIAKVADRILYVKDGCVSERR